MRWKAVLEVLSKDAIPNGILETFVLGTGTTYTTPSDQILDHYLRYRNLYQEKNSTAYNCKLGHMIFCIYCLLTSGGRNQELWYMWFQAESKLNSCN
jgi:hypothetical protein